MRTKHANLLVPIFLFATVTVNLCHGYSLKEPGTYTASFSKSSSSASASSQSSSSSYTLSGNVDPSDVEKLKEALKVGAVAHASAGAIASSGSDSGAIAAASATAGAAAASEAVSVAGISDSSAAIDNAQHGSGDVVQANSASGNIDGVNSNPGCSGDGSCNKAIDSNSIGATSNTDSGAYKVIGSDKYSTTYSGGSKTNYAVSGAYVQPTQNSVGGCPTCKGPFPGPSGSIHDYKLATSVPAVPHTASVPTVQPIAPTIASGSSYTTAGTGGAAVEHHSHTPTTIHNLPGPTGSIYQSKPVTQHGVSTVNVGHSSSEHGHVTQTEYSSGHVSPGLVATLPGPSGSIYDSKPAGAVAGAGSTATANAGSYSDVGVTHHTQPTVVPTCSGSGCGGHAAPGPALVNIIPTLPGPSGSIYDSKPAVGGGATHHTSGSTGSSSTTYTGSGTIVTNLPTNHPVVGPACGYTPGAVSGGCAGQEDKNVHAGANANTAYSGAGSANFNPYAHQPTDGTKYTNTGSSSVNTNTDSGAYSGAGSATFNPYAHQAVDDTKHTTTGSSSVHTNTDKGAYSGAGSVTNIPSSHPVFGPVCSYSPGSKSNCGSGSAAQAEVSESGSNTAVEHGAGTAALTPSIHPEIPSAGTYYVNKPTVDVVPPHLPSQSFTGQIPCADSSCGNVQKVPQVTEPQPPECGVGDSCGGAIGGSIAGAQSSAASGVTYENKETSGHYSSTIGINSDNAHLSGGVVFQNEDGSYLNLPKETQSTYKNSDKGGYAVSSNEKDNTGILIGPGTGHLPVESDHKPFGTQGAFGGSAAFNKKNNEGSSQGAFGGSSTAAVASSSATAHSSSEHTTTSNTGHGSDITIQKIDGIAVTPVDDGFAQPSCGGTSNCGNVVNNLPTGSGSGTLFVSTETSKSNSNTGGSTVSYTGTGSTSGSVSGSDDIYGITSGSTVGTVYTSIPTHIGTDYSNGANTANNHEYSSTSGSNIKTGYTNIPAAGSHTGHSSSANTDNSHVHSSTSGSHTGTGYTSTPIIIPGNGYSGGVVATGSNTNYNHGSYSGTVASAESSTHIHGGSGHPNFGSSGTGSNTERVDLGHKQSGTPVKLDCLGPACKDGSTQVYIIEEKPQHGYGYGPHRHGIGYHHHHNHGVNSGYSSGSVIIREDEGLSRSNGFGGSYGLTYGGSYNKQPIAGYSPGCESGKCGYGLNGHHNAGNTGYATGQVLVNQGTNTLDVTNSGSNGFGGYYGGSGYQGSSGCPSGKCGGYSGASGGAYSSPAGFLEGLFGKGGLSGNVFNTFGGGNGGQAGSAAYSSAGAYGGASAGSFSSAGAGAAASAGATASAGSYARSY